MSAETIKYWELLNHSTVQTILTRGKKRGFYFDNPKPIDETVLDGTNDLVLKPQFSETELRNIISYVNFALLDSNSKLDPKYFIDADKTTLEELTQSDLKTICNKLLHLHSEIKSNFGWGREIGWGELIPEPFKTCLSELKLLIRKIAIYNYWVNGLPGEGDTVCYIQKADYNFILHGLAVIKKLPAPKQPKIERTNAVRDFYGSYDEYYKVVI